MSFFWLQTCSVLIVTLFCNENLAEHGGFGITNPKNCGTQLPVIANHDFVLQTFLDMVEKVEQEIKTLKPTSLMIVIGEDLHTTYIKRALGSPIELQRNKVYKNDKTPFYPVTVNTTSGTEKILVFSSRLDYNSLTEAVTLSYLMSRVNKSRLLIVPTANASEDDNFLRLVAQQLTKWASNTSLENSVGIALTSASDNTLEKYLQAKAHLEFVLNSVKNITNSRKLPINLLDYRFATVINTESLYPPNVYAKDLYSLISNLQPVELMNTEPKWFLGECTWEEKMDEVSQTVQTEINEKVTKLVESIQSDFIHAFVGRMKLLANQTVFIEDFERNCERLLSITQKASSENIFDVIHNISTAFDYNPYENESFDAGYLKYLVSVAANFLRFRGISLDGKWMTTIHKFSLLCNSTSQIASFVEQLRLTLELPKIKDTVAHIFSSRGKHGTLQYVLETQGIATMEPELKSLVNMHPQLVRFFSQLVGLHAKRIIQIRCEKSDLKESGKFELKKLVLTGNVVAVSDIYFMLSYSIHLGSDLEGECNTENVNQLLLLASESVYLNMDLDATEPVAWRVCLQVDTCIQAVPAEGRTGLDANH